MPEEKFDSELLQKIISLHEAHLREIPETHLNLYEIEDAIMWDGYIKPVVELNEAIDAAFRFNSNIEPVDLSLAYKPDGIENLTLEQLGFVFRDILVNEKFHQGLFVDVIMDGKINRLVTRLKIILGKHC